MQVKIKFKIEIDENKTIELDETEARILYNELLTLLPNREVLPYLTHPKPIIFYVSDRSE